MIIIVLTEQVHLYSVDTSYFYTKEEEAVNKSLNVRYFYRSKLKKKLERIQRRQKQLRKLKLSDEEEDVVKVRKYCSEEFMNEQVKVLGGRLSIVDSEVRVMKDELRRLQDKNNDQRKISIAKLKTRDIVSLFKSSLTRAIDIPTGYLTTDLIIVKTFYFKVLEDIIMKGFTMGGHEYVPFTASAGQIRTKKTVFIKKNVFEQISPKLMCGLTPEIINQKGGINVNKYLAYLALSNSATEIWQNFDINKAIVVDDMETDVVGIVDYIDYNDYSITRQEMGVPVPHTDGCGMMLPRMGEDKVKMKSMMIRMPWVKGLLIPFPFDKFIREHNRNNPNSKIGKIKDIYGKEYDILEDGIEVILTKSQFKMWRYYDSWEEYKENFINNECEPGYCNEEPDSFGNAKLNYQMLQTLTDITKDELEKLSRKTSGNIRQMGRDRNTMLKSLGVTDHNINKNNYQKALEIYPELLRDTHGRQAIKSAKEGMVKKARSARLDLNAMYTFIVPDLYAVCEYILGKNENPKGLLTDGEVSCRLYEHGKKIDCLRSPHLYREHAIRTNVVTRETNRWFLSKGLHTSVHDLISKMLQFDVDGDQSLVVGDELFVEIAERNMEGIVPLYYKMEESISNKISRDSIYTSMTNAYSGGNIGAVSNNITKIWNSENPNLDMIKILVMENNFVIDYAKSLYKPTRPPHIKRMLTEYTRSKLPYFFMYAKDKKRRQVESKNDSTVNMLKDIIPNDRIVFKNTNVGKFDYTMLMNDRSYKLSDEDKALIDKYHELDLHKYFLINYQSDKENNLIYLYQDIKDRLIKIGTDESRATDILIKYLYEHRDSDYKTTLWESFGDRIVMNLENNIKKPLSDGWIMCDKCGKRTLDTNHRTTMCCKCGEEKAREQRNRWKRENRRKRINL